MADIWNYVLNQNYLIEYTSTKAKIYEIISNAQTNLILQFSTEEDIKIIKFNPLVSNIIIISFYNGTCKIYNILNKSEKEDILFESKKEKSIKLSVFNNFDPNIIATLSWENKIYIWDIRKLYYINIFNFYDKEINMKWSYYGTNYLEIEYEKNGKTKIELININDKSIKYDEKTDEELIKFLYLKGDVLILIKNNKLEKIDLNTNDINKLNFDEIINSKEDLIKDNNILSIILSDEFYFINYLKFEIIEKIKFNINFNNYFFFVKDKNEIILKYIKQRNALGETSFNINNYNLKINYNKDLPNIKNNFYVHFYPKMLKFMCLLNFNDNIQESNNNIKKYMSIPEINKFFEKIKQINIFKRKDFVIQLFDLNIFDNQIFNINEELNIKKFPKIRKYNEIFKYKEIKSRKDKFIEIIKKDKDLDNNNNFIKEFYIETIKLLTMDNTNEKLLEIYLLFLQLYEKDIIIIYGIENIEKYNIEVNYYSVCFSKDDYKSLFNIDKISEKEKLLSKLNKAYNLKNFDYTNLDFKNFIKDFKESLEGFPDFNQPIEFDCNNNELKWYNVKLNIFITFRDIEINKNNKFKLIDIRAGLKKVIENKLFENEDIINNKNKLQSVVYLITNPCSSNDKNKPLDFFCNCLLSKSNDINKLKENYKIIDDNKLEYNNQIYDNIKDICIENLSYENYFKEQKYNFTYLVNNYVKNKEKIKQFLLNILKKRVCKEAYDILFEDNNYKLLDERYLEEFINKRLEFIPIKFKETIAISNKISLNTFILTYKKIIISKEYDQIETEVIEEILYTSGYILTEEHEIFHLLDCIPYYENNCSLSINTPRKKNFKVEEERKGKSINEEKEAEGGLYLEFLLFGKELKTITLEEALFILNEKNYEKSISEFINCFKNIDKSDLIIEGVFKDFNEYFVDKEISNEDLKSSAIELKSSYDSDFLKNCYIEINIKNDVAGRIHKNK